MVRPGRAAGVDARPPAPGALGCCWRAEHGEDWVAAASVVAGERDLPLDAYRAGPGGDLQGGDGAWYALRGHDAEGVVIVRPDGHVAYRSHTGVADAPGALRAALDVALATAGVRA